MTNSFNENQEKMTLKGYFECLPDPVKPKNEFIREVMDRCNVRENTVYNWINGRTHASDPKHIEVLCDITKLTPEQLWMD